MAKEFSRRTFIAGAAAVGAALAAGSYLGGKYRQGFDITKLGEGYDVLVVGSGGAGLRAALAAAEDKSLRVAVLTKLVPTRSAFSMAQGGTNGVLGVSDPGDSAESFAVDTIKGGVYLSDQDAVAYFAEHSGEALREVEYLGTPYNRQKDGDIVQKKAGGHSHARTAYYEKSVGQATLHALFYACLERGITILPEYQMLEIVQGGAGKDSLQGVVAMDMHEGRVRAIPAKSVVLATGGYGRVYWGRTTNPFSSTGDGIAMGMRAGIPFKDPEMVQYQALSLTINAIPLPAACLQAGAQLLNKDGDRFMARVDPEKMEQTAGMKLCRAVMGEILAGRGIGTGTEAGVWLDCSTVPQEKWKTLGAAVKMIHRYTGQDIHKDKVLVSPMHHYSMGGLEVADFETGATRAAGIFAAGECSCVSIHGANRIGSNSTAEALVFGRTAGLGAAAYAKKAADAGRDTLDKAAAAWQDRFTEVTSRTSGDGAYFADIRKALAQTIWQNAGPVRSAESLAKAQQDLAALDAAYASCWIGDSSPVYNTAFSQYIELGSMLTVAHGIVAGALARAESRGGHFRQDFPKRDDTHFLKHTLVSCHDGAYEVDAQAVTITKYPPQDPQAKGAKEGGKA